MVAYSFKRRFVAPIQAGLGILPGIPKVHHGESIGPSARSVVEYLPATAPPHPKRQTIRAHRRRHARPGEELQLYCGQRTKGCFLIGKARCVGAESIRLLFGRRTDVIINRVPINPTDANLDKFARADGFADWNALREFWSEEHGAIERFDGVIIYWEPLA